MRRSVAAALLLPALVGGFALQAWGGHDGERLFHEVIAAVSGRGLDSLSEAQLYESAARGLLVEIGDPYADLFSPEQLAAFTRETLRNSYGGLGMQITRVRDTTVVTRVFPGSPAARAGVRAGDRIVAANGDPLIGLALDQVTSRLIGQPGTGVAVNFHRPGEGVLRREFVREQIRNPSVPFAILLEPGIGYVPLSGFNDSSGDDVLRALVELRKSGAQGFVLDLRGNTGGSLEQAVRITNLFLSQGEEVLRARYRNAPDEVYGATEVPLLPEAPLVVLTDGASASAAEIVAGALQDHDRAVIVGDTTFGKGLVQDVFRLDGGWALKLTTGRWYTPSGRTIQRPRRLTPDGRLVAVAPDSGPPPLFRSDAGRPLTGGGGISPDLAVHPDTLRGAERELMLAFAGRGALVNEALQEMAVDLMREVSPGFTATPAWRQDLYGRLGRRGVQVERTRWDAGAALVDRLLEERVAELAFGDSAAFRRAVERDRPLLEALRVLRGAESQVEALSRTGYAPAPDPAGT